MMDRDSDFEKLTNCLIDIGIKFRTTDDSAESTNLDTVVVLDGDEYMTGDIYIFFTRNGEFKNEIDVV